MTRTHGFSRKVGRNLAYTTWMNMTQRCGNPNNPSFADYGGAGVLVCERWLSFENFLADMGPRPVGTSIDRIDGSLGYEPGNCRWATRTIQNRNRPGHVRLDAVSASQIRWLVLDGGIRQKDVAKAFGVSKTAIAYVVSGRIWRDQPMAVADAMGVES